MNFNSEKNFFLKLWGFQTDIMNYVCFSGSDVFASVLMWGGWVVLFCATVFASFYKSQATEREKQKYIELIRTGGAIGFIIEPREFIPLEI